MKKMDPVERLNYENKVKSGAGWFTIIALLTLINSIIALSGQDWGFAVGLGLTIFTDAAGMALAEQYGLIAKVGTFAISFIAAGTFFLIGLAASKKRVALFVIGAILYGLDTLVTLLTMDPVAIGIHLFIMIFLISAIHKCRRLMEINKQESQIVVDKNPLSQLFSHYQNASGTTPQSQPADASPPPPPSLASTPALPEAPPFTGPVHAPTAEITTAMESLKATESVSSFAEAPPHAAAIPGPPPTENRLKVRYRD